MSRQRHHKLTLLYPPAWRERYGEEMDDLLRGGAGRETRSISLPPFR